MSVCASTLQYKNWMLRFNLYLSFVFFGGQGWEQTQTISGPSSEHPEAKELQVYRN